MTPEKRVCPPVNRLPAGKEILVGEEKMRSEQYTMPCVDEFLKFLRQHLGGLFVPAQTHAGDVSPVEIDVRRPAKEERLHLFIELPLTLHFRRNENEHIRIEQILVAGKLGRPPIDTHRYGAGRFDESIHELFGHKFCMTAGRCVDDREGHHGDQLV